MSSSQPERRVISSFTSQQWSGRPGQNGLSIFVGSCVIGLVLCLILMIFVPGLRSSGATTVFTALFAVGLTTLAVASKSSAERAFLRRVTADVNGTLVGVTGNPHDSLTVEEFRAVMEYGRRVPLLVNGVPGIDLSIVRDRPSVAREPVVKRVDNEVRTTRVVITVTPPDYGVTSFDRLLAAAIADPDSAGGTG